MTAEEFQSGTAFFSNNVDKTAKVSPTTSSGTKSTTTATTASKDSSDERVVEVELVDGPIPRVRPFGSASIPRKTQFEDTRPSNREYRQRPQKVNVDWSPSKPREAYHTSRAEKVNVDWSPSKPREYFYNGEKKKNVRYHRPLDPSGPRVYRQDQPPPSAPRRKRRLYRVTPDQIL